MGTRDSHRSTDEHLRQQEVEQGTLEQRQEQDLQQHRRRPSDEERQVRRQQGGHDRPLGDDHVPRPRPEAVPRDQARSNPGAGLDREVGDLDDPDAVETNGALPGRAGGGLAGG